MYRVYIYCTFLYVFEIVTRKYYTKIFFVVGWNQGIVKDDELVYSLSPNQNVTWQRYGTLMRFHTNNLGFRGIHDTIIPKPTGVFRVLMAGDSFVFGDGLSEAETIPSVVQNALAEAVGNDKRIEIINMGVPGYSPDQSYRQLMKYIPLLQLDLIVWNFISWHINGMVNKTGQQYYRPSLYALEHDGLKDLDARFNKIYIHNRLLAYAPRVIKHSYLFDFLLNRLFYSPFFSGIPNKSRKDKLVWAQKKLGLEIRSLSGVSKENGSKFMFVVLPSLDGLSEETNGDFLEFLGAVKEQAGAPFSDSLVDLNGELLARQAGSPEQYSNTSASVLGTKNESPNAYFFDSPNEHPNSRGAFVFADLLADHIRQNIISSDR